MKNFLAVGADELKEDLGKTITCPLCGKEHEIVFGEEVMKDGSRKPCSLLSFYNCGDKTYLAGISGKALPPKK